MANTKTYAVVKNGETLKELKTLTAAKKLADAEGAEVFCEGECVYQAAADPVSATLPAVEETVVETVAEEQKPVPETYTLLRKMNVRKEPSLTAAKVKVLNAGTEVLVAEIVDDWLHLADGTFILFEGGKNARKGNG